MEPGAFSISLAVKDIEASRLFPACSQRATASSRCKTCWTARVVSAPRDCILIIDNSRSLRDDRYSHF